MCGYGAPQIMEVQPGVSTIRYATIGSMYTTARNYAPELKSHMLKNSEWGAVAYLTESTYGRNGTEPGHNETHITGGGAEKAYIENANQSSTGNVYGIYDLRGGSVERTVAYYIDGEETCLNDGLEFTATKTSDAYSTVYNGTKTSENYKYGDATFETTYWPGGGPMNNDHTIFLSSELPFFSRGSVFSVTNMGLFCLGMTKGRSWDYYDSFRIAIIV